MYIRGAWNITSRSTRTHRYRSYKTNSSRKSYRQAASIILAVHIYYIVPPSSKYNAHRSPGIMPRIYSYAYSGISLLRVLIGCNRRGQAGVGVIPTLVLRIMLRVHLQVVSYNSSTAAAAVVLCLCQHGCRAEVDQPHQAPLTIRYA